METPDQSGREGRLAPAIVAALEHLTGASRGTLSWIASDDVDVLLTPSHQLLISDNEDEDERPANETIAHISHRHGEYVLEALDQNKIWVNASLVAKRHLQQSDVIEFRDDGPIVRLRLFREGGHPQPTVSDILLDTVSYLRVSRRPIPQKIGRATATLFRRLVTETTFLFRSSIVLAVLVLALFGYQQEQDRSRLMLRMEDGAARLESFAAALNRAREETLKPVDLRELKEDLSKRLTFADQRLEFLEKRSQASKDVIARSFNAVAFLQGAYGFRHEANGRMLRHVVDPTNGQKLFSPMGQPMLTLEGDGPVAERQFTGTGFKVLDRRLIATNRHVALPWENDAASESLRGQGLLPVMVRFVGYFPNVPTALPLELAIASESADLALLTFTTDDHSDLPAGLRLFSTVPRAGTEVIVMGYPTGLKSLLAQTGTPFIEKLEVEGATEFWSVADRLSKSGYIAPLASRGIVGQATRVTVVYDAETTHGGSGGPVLDANGFVVAVNTAILPEYGGSNLGIPARLLQSLVDTNGLR